MITQTFSENGVEYGYSVQAKKWAFNIVALRHTALLSLARVKQKQEVARKIARILNGAAKRGGMDGLARKNIKDLIDRAE